MKILNILVAKLKQILTFSNSEKTTPLQVKTKVNPSLNLKPVILKAYKELYKDEKISPQKVASHLNISKTKLCQSLKIELS
jgi:hypothetical protein